MIDPIFIASGVTSGIAESKLKDGFNTLTHQLTGTAELDWQAEQFVLLEKWYMDWKGYIAGQTGRSDIEEFIVFGKLGQAPKVIAQLIPRRYIEVLSAVAVTLDVQSDIGLYSVNVPVGTWTTLSVDSSSVVYLDSSAATNTQLMKARYTDDKP